MRVRPSGARRAAVLFICAALLLPFIPRGAAAKDGPRIVIQIGQPAVWSLGQAHYLLAKMHRTNRKLNTRFPSPEDLDSNRIAATRIEALRSSLGVEGQFDQAMAVRNDLALRRFREGEVRRETARTDLRARQAELQQANSDLLELNEQIAVLEEVDRQTAEARAAAEPPEPPSDKDNARKTEMARLKVRRTRKAEERDELKAQVAALTTTVDTPTAAPALEAPALTTGNGALPSSETFDAFMKKAVEEAGKPDLSASMKLDNFVQMQYEIISKQLTLLRDEVGPDDRVIFLELPADIFSVEGKADDYVAQVEWDVEAVCDKEPPGDVQEPVIRDIFRKEGKSEEEAEKMMLRIEKVREARVERQARLRFLADEKAQLQMAAVEARLKGLTTADEKMKKAALEEEERRLLRPFLEEERKKIKGAAAPYPVTLEMIKRYDATPEGKCPSVDRERVRAIDVIPRQSALNVNERHAVVKQTMILAAFKFLVGFAGKVNYQRQRELYEQFVQQQVFASGYGKGDDRFGWTYGPQPGTRRLSTGERTTFAVLVVPRNTLAVRVKARSRYFKMNKSPQDPDAFQATPTPTPTAGDAAAAGMGESRERPKGDVIKSADTTFFLSVPGKRTQEFWVEGVSYTPVRKGRRVTAVVEGNYFSPQLGILVNGVPLEPVLSVSRIAGGDEEPDVTSADGVAGEYEVTNSRQIVMSFKMPDDYVGTPTVTFTSPEKSTAINFFDLDINHHPDRLTSLQEQSVREPMFADEFSLGQKLEPMSVADVCNISDEGVLKKIKDGGFGLARLTGTGLRPSGSVLVNNVGLTGVDYMPMEEVCKRITAEPEKEFAVQDSTRAYTLYFKGRGAKRKVAFRQPTRQGYDEGSVAEDFPSLVTSVRNYRFVPGAGRAEVDLTFTSAKPISAVELDDPPPTRRDNCQGVKPGGENAYRVKCFVPADNGGKLERDFVTVKVTFAAGGDPRYEDIRLPVRPLVASLVNPRTGRAVGFVDEEPTVVITGANLQGVKSVFFGDKEAKVLAASADSVTVRVPKGAAVPKGQAAAVPVSLQGPGAQPVPSGAVYTYLGEPPTPNVVVWPYPAGRP